MRCPALMFRRAFVLVGLAAIPAIKAEKLVLAHSTATREYLQMRMVNGKLQPQTYVFMPGRYFAGNTHDNSLEKTSFRTIAERLALDLRQQDFHPAPSLAKADLLLIVHWGVTAGRNRDAVAMATSMENLANLNLAGAEAQRQLDDANARGDIEAAGQARGDLGNLQSETRSEYQTLLRGQSSGGEDSAALLGLTAALHKDDDNLFEYERRKTLFEMTREECYFVIVMAYDAPTLLGTRKLKRLWTLRASVNSAGVNFPEALDRIGNIAGRYSGTKQEGIAFDYPRARTRTEHVDLGDLIVLGAVSPTSAEAKLP
jgi:hypothetical protein